jgi:hypothetical protein
MQSEYRRADHFGPCYKSPSRRPAFSLNRLRPHQGAFILGMQPRLPSRFPVGTLYIVEGKPGTGGKLRIVSRYVVMPSGIRYDLMPPAQWARKPADLASKGRSRTPRSGTTEYHAGQLHSTRM